MKTTLYQILGIEPTASLDEVRAAYARKREAAEKAGESNALALLGQALEVLTDPLQRNAYDASRATSDEAEAATPRGRAHTAASPISTTTWLAIIGAVAVLVGTMAWMLARREPPKPVAPAVIAEAPKTNPAAVAAPSAPIAPAPTANAGANSGAVALPPAAPTSPVGTPAAVESAPPPPPPSVLLRAAEPDPPPVERSAESVFADAARSVARINVGDASGRNVALGSGIVIEPDVVLTSCHVAKAGPKLTVKLGGSTFPGTILLADEEYDLCRLAVPALRALPVKIGKVASLKTGQKVFAIGAPAGLDLTISEGIVSSLRTIDEGTVIQTTAPISPGSSGGGLFDASARLVGIVTFQHRFGQNLNFALPADWIGRMQERGPSGTGWRGATVSARPTRAAP